MRFRLPLYGQILLWFFLNLGLVALGAWFILPGRFPLGLDSLVTGDAGAQVQAVAELLHADLRDRPRSEWPEVVQRLGSAYRIHAVLAPFGGAPLIGDTTGGKIHLPEELSRRLRTMAGPGRLRMDNRPFRPRAMPGGPPNGPPDWPNARQRPRDDLPESDLDPDPDRPSGSFSPNADGPPPGNRGSFATPPPGAGPPDRDPDDPNNPELDGAPRSSPNFGTLDPNGPPSRRDPPGSQPRRGPFPRALVKTAGSPRYWIGMPLPPLHSLGPEQSPVSLVLASDSLTFGGLLVDPKPFLFFLVGAALFSALFWFPFVRSLTGTLGKITSVTEKIASGSFDDRVTAHRGDELGRLSTAVNRMADRLAGFVAGQRRFLGDTAHELCSPLARAQMALGILEQRAPAESAAYVTDVREEIEHMSQLAHELLSFSRASLQPQRVALQNVDLATLAARIVARENASSGAEIHLEIPAGLHIQADPELAGRALANALRNAIRYAAKDGPITVSAEAAEKSVTLTVADVGPGVAPADLPRLFDPFFRPDVSRTEATGGTGLGLTIVKTCVEACGGTVACQNRQPKGFEVLLTFPSAPSGSV